MKLGQHIFFYCILIILLIRPLMLFLSSLSTSHTMDAPTKSTMTFAILLTSYMEESRREMYNTNIMRWLNESPFDIYVVDSSGLGTFHFSHPRLQFFSFLQKQCIAQVTQSVLEADSIVRALENFALSDSNCDLVFKVTGKYFIPDFLHHTKDIPKGTEAVFQSIFSQSWQNSECFGMKPSLMKSSMSMIGRVLMEEHLSELLKQNKWQIFRLEPLPLDRKIPRNDGSILPHL